MRVWISLWHNSWCCLKDASSLPSPIEATKSNNSSIGPYYVDYLALSFSSWLNWNTLPSILPLANHRNPLGTFSSTHGCLALELQPILAAEFMTLSERPTKKSQISAQVPLKSHLSPDGLSEERTVQLASLLTGLFREREIVSETPFTQHRLSRAHAHPMSSISEVQFSESAPPLVDCLLLLAARVRVSVFKNILKSQSGI